MWVRRATAADASQIARVHVSTWRDAYRGIVPEEHLNGLDEAERAQVWHRRLADSETDMVTMVAGDPEVVGFCSFGPAREDGLAPRCGEIYAIYVSSSRWSTGVGSTLMEASLQELSGYDEVVLWVLADNVRARHFYARCGFTADGSGKKVQLGGVELEEVRYRAILARGTRLPHCATMPR